MTPRLPQLLDKVTTAISDAEATIQALVVDLQSAEDRARWAEANLRGADTVAQTVRAALVSLAERTHRYLDARTNGEEPSAEEHMDLAVWAHDLAHHTDMVLDTLSGQRAGGLEAEIAAERRRADHFDAKASRLAVDSAVLNNSTGDGFSYAWTPPQTKCTAKDEDGAGCYLVEGHDGPHKRLSVREFGGLFDGHLMAEGNSSNKAADDVTPPTVAACRNDCRCTVCGKPWCEDTSMCAECVQRIDATESAGYRPSSPPSRAPALVVTDEDARFLRQLADDEERRWQEGHVFIPSQTPRSLRDLADRIAKAVNAAAWEKLYE